MLQPWRPAPALERWDSSDVRVHAQMSHLGHLRNINAQSVPHIDNVPKILV